MLSMHATSTVVLLSSLTLVAGQVDFGGYTFEADPLTIGDLAVWSIFGLAFAVFSFLCFVTLVIQRGHRSPFAPLLPSLLFSFLQAVAEIVYIVLSSNGIGIPPTGPMVAMNVIAILCANWTGALLFLSVFLAIKDRYTTIDKLVEGRGGKPNIVFLILGFFWFTFLVIFGAAVAGLYGAAQNVFWELENDDFLSDLAFDEQLVLYAQKLKIARNANYAYGAFFDLTTFIVAAFAIYTYTMARRVQHSDKLLKLVLFLIVPLYAVNVIFSIIFTIVFSPAGIENSTSILASERATLASDILLNLSFLAIAAPIVILGFSKANWRGQGGSAPQGVAPVMMQPYPQQGQYQTSYYPQQQFAHPQQPPYDSSTNLKPGTPPQGPYQSWGEGAH